MEVLEVLLLRASMRLAKVGVGTGKVGLRGVAIGSGSDMQITAETASTSGSARGVEHQNLILMWGVVIGGRAGSPQPHGAHRTKNSSCARSQA